MYQGQPGSSRLEILQEMTLVSAKIFDSPFVDLADEAVVTRGPCQCPTTTRAGIMHMAGD